jgi:hypothetical protein
MTINGKPLTANHWIISILAVGILCAAFVRFVSSIPWPFVAFGLLLLAASFLLPKDSYSGETALVDQRGMDMELPSRWDQNEITLGVERYRGSPNLLRRYMEGVFGRFVDGQDTQTLEKRREFLESFNRFAEVRRETFKWQRIMQKRATLEEDLADTKAEIELQKARNDLDGTTVDSELIELQKKAKRMEIQIQIAQSEKTIADLKRPEPPPPAPPAAPPSAKEAREIRIVELRARETNLISEKRRVDGNPNLTDEQRERQHNSIDDQLALVHEELAELL